MQKAKRFRRNTLQEKRKMRNERKKRKRKLTAEVQFETKLRVDAERKVVLYKNMSRSYWERWRWELQQRKDLMLQERGAYHKLCGHKTSDKVKVLEIDPTMLKDPVNADGQSTEKYIGRGSFAVVKLQTYRGYNVAVKKFLPSTVCADVHREAEVLAQFCHPYLPMLFGVVTSTPPYRIIMQHHGLSGQSGLSVTLSDVLMKREKYDDNTMFTFCAQLAEVLQYLHDEVQILHNDLKCNNVVICDSVKHSPTVDEAVCGIQIMLIDFGKATGIHNGKIFRLTDAEKFQYIKYYPHIAPEVIQGSSRQSKLTDIYSLGVIFHKIFDHGIVKNKSNSMINKLDDIATKCRSPHSFSRPDAKKVSGIIKKILE